VNIRYSKVTVGIIDVSHVAVHTSAVIMIFGVVHTPFVVLQQLVAYHTARTALQAPVVVVPLTAYIMISRIAVIRHSLWKFARIALKPLPTAAFVHTRAAAQYTWRVDA
jgi:hypothetical protein